MDIIKKYSYRFQLLSSYYDAHNFTSTYTFLDLVNEDKFALSVPEFALIDVVIETELSEKVRLLRESTLNKLLK